MLSSVAAATGHDPPTRGTHRRRGRWSLLLRLAVTAAVISAITLALERTGRFKNVEARWNDAMVGLFRPAPSGSVVLVGITDRDHARADLFKYSAPLDPGTLLRLIHQVALCRPAVVAVDIDLQPHPYEPRLEASDRRRLYWMLRDLARQGSTTWIVAKAPPASHQPHVFDESVVEAWDSLLVAASSASTRLHFASPDFELEEGLARHMPLSARDASTGSLTPTLLGAVARSWSAQDVPAAKEADKELLIRYTGRFTLNDSLRTTQFATSAGDLLASPIDATGTNDITGRIVVVGGMFRASRDEVWTPIGRLYAAEVWAEAIDTWVRGDSPRHVSWFWAFLLETAIGLGGGLLMARFNPLVGYLLALPILAIITVLASILMFGLGLVMMSALPSFFSVQVHQRYELWRENRQLQRRVGELEAGR